MCRWQQSFLDNVAGQPVIRAIFICTENRLRSPTSERILSAWTNVETDSAGLSEDANVPVSAEQIEWATVIFVREEVHGTKFCKRFKRHLIGKQRICLNIPDECECMQSELVSMLEERAGPFLLLQP
jgi:predicted protein tyrosine phosphatase